MKAHYFDMQVNSINRDGLNKLEKSKVLFKNSDSIPEGDNIKVFQGIFSQNFKKGEKSRNGYKYDQDGWFVDNYAMLPIILWQHDDSYGGIGFTSELYTDSKGNLSGVFYVDLDMLEDRNRKQVEKGFVTMVSTGAITKESMYEDNKTGKRYSEDEAIKEYGVNDVIEALYGYTDSVLTYVVTKAELIENSLVTIGSNFGAIAKTVNSIGDEMETIANQMKSKQDKNILISKDSTMNLEEAMKEIDSLSNKAETLTNDISEKDIKINALNDEVSGQATKIDSLEKEVNSLKAEVEKSSNTIKKLEDEAKEVILANANIDNSDEANAGGVDTDEVTTAQDFVKKYS